MMNRKQSARCLALCTVIFFLLCTGCSLSSDAFIDVYFTAVKNHNTSRLTAMSTPSFTAQFSDMSYAKRAFVHGMEDIQWTVHDMYTTPDGMTYVIYVRIQQKGRPENDMNATLYVYLVEDDNKWYVNGIDVSMELYTTPPKNSKTQTENTTTPDTQNKTVIDEPLSLFARRYDESIKNRQN